MILSARADRAALCKRLSKRLSMVTNPENRVARLAILPSTPEHADTSAKWGLVRRDWRTIHILRVVSINEITHNVC